MRKFIYLGVALAGLLAGFSEFLAALPPPKDELPKVEAVRPEMGAAKTEVVTHNSAKEAKKSFDRERRFIRDMSEVIRIYGYDCEMIEHVYPRIFSRGFDVFCRGRLGTLYEFSMVDHGGKWSVTAD